MTGILQRGEFGHRHKHTGRIPAEIAILYLEAKECQGLAETEGTNLVNTLISDF